MTRDEAREFAKRLRETADVAEAFADGADVQCEGVMAWYDDRTPAFHPARRWRVKPKEPRHLWTVVQNGRRKPTWTFFVEEFARTQRDGLNETSPGEPYTIIHSIEVLP